LLHRSGERDERVDHVKEHVADAAHSTETAAVEEGTVAHTIRDDSFGHRGRDSGQRVDLCGRRHVEIEFACDIAGSVERADGCSRRPLRRILRDFSAGVSRTSATRGAALRTPGAACRPAGLPIEGSVCRRIGGLLL
jgi:hypothetical protein